jgi:predicted metal-dependent phosphoesterase TrpH
MSKASSPRITAALHVHTLYSPCAETKLEAIPGFCREKGIGVIGIADHDTIAGALELKAIADGLRVIVCEEVLTADGEIIGMFLHDEIEPGQSALETCEQIKAQGGLICIPHPFDPLKIRRLRKRALMDVLEYVDIIEVFNAKLNLPVFNVVAAKFAFDYGKAGAAGSDAHYLQAIDVCTNEMDDFSTPEEFLANLHHARLTTHRAYPMRTWWIGIKNALRGEGHHLKRYGRKPSDHRR